MKHLPCPTPSCVGKGAMLPPSDAFPHGEPYLAGAYTKVVRCYRCKRASILSMADYNRRPDLTLDNFKALAVVYAAPQLATLPTRDIEAAGFKRGQAEDLFRAGLQDAHELAALERDNEPERQFQDALARGMGRVEVVEAPVPLPKRGRARRRSA